MSESMDSSQLESQFSVVENLLKQQDEVILQLDQLNGEIEGLIKQLAQERAEELGETQDAQESDAAPARKAA